MKKSQAQNLIKLSDECPKCKKGKMKVVEGFINIGNWFLRCENCGFEWDD